ncbi:hypothetical protein EDEG_00601 [Edhazardia aedis USNM 41457]|uniref:Uncharacterized protein n=1 Tax=Edhazardia aedis (strain USNM 41457) TaxID=1003232 RepID=J9DS22_EDHAE|nr:hypothetical protein EDEG_00601 [Edhazardia aedis USNM 41457]|eukprot:EJW05375.1 hypothetical protein EDEG_00601 [Edhazardia aedis USNM 41457]
MNALIRFWIFVFLRQNYKLTKNSIPIKSIDGYINSKLACDVSTKQSYIGFWFFYSLSKEYQNISKKIDESTQNQPQFCQKIANRRIEVNFKQIQNNLKFESTRKYFNHTVLKFLSNIISKDAEGNLAANDNSFDIKLEKIKYTSLDFFCRNKKYLKNEKKSIKVFYLFYNVDLFKKTKNWR